MEDMVLTVVEPERPAQESWEACSSRHTRPARMLLLGEADVAGGHS